MNKNLLATLITAGIIVFVTGFISALVIYPKQLGIVILCCLAIWIVISIWRGVRKILNALPPPHHDQVNQHIEVPMHVILIHAPAPLLEKELAIVPVSLRSRIHHDLKRGRRLSRFVHLQIARHPVQVKRDGLFEDIGDGGEVRHGRGNY